MDIYEKNGLVRPINSDGSVAHKVTKVKAFARPLSESILLDPKGEFGVGTDAKAINQHLINGVEEFNGSPRETFTVYDNGEATEVTEDGKISCATTTVYPVRYTEQPYSSDNHLDMGINGNIYGTLSVPITPEEGSFTYSGDIGFNFDVEQDIDLSSAYGLGDNVVLEAYDNGSGKTIPMVRLVNTSLRESASNYVDAVFTAPHGNRYGEAEIKYLTVQYPRLNSALTSFLDARNYYEEITIPNDVYSGTTPIKVGRNNGIRTLKEGEYYFTSKYPFKILPISDAEMDTNISGMNFANIYGAVRFKIVVKGELCRTSSSEMSNLSQNYRDSMVRQYLQSLQALTNPSDNRTFPHRRINIDMYVMTKSSNGWAWQIVASNHNTSYGVLKLDAEALSKSITLTRPVPMFFSKSYTSSFFTGSSKAPTFDEVRVKIGNTEDIWADASNDISEFTLQSEKSYRFLFDYTANTPEIAFFDGNHGEGDYLNISSTELSDYAKMVKINSDDVMESDYMYNRRTDGWMTSSANMLKGTCGYAIDVDTTTTPFTCSWSQESNAFGDPYMKSYGQNKLYQFDSDYSAVDDNYIVPYMYDASYHTVSCVPISNGFFNELSIISDHHSVKMRNATSAVATLKSSTAGLISAMSLLVPVFTSTDIIPTVITHEDYDYISYTASRRNIPTVTDGLTVESTELFGNNMIVTQQFNDPLWSIRNTSVQWEDDDTYKERKNVWKFNLGTSDVNFTYGENTNTNILSNWEVSVCASGSGIEGIDVWFIDSDGVSVRGQLTKEKQLTSSWWVWSNSFSDKSCTSIRFTFVGSGTAKATKFVARRRRTTSHPYGLGDCLKTTTATALMTLPRHDMLMMRNRTDNWLTPLMVRSSVETLNNVSIPVSGVTNQYRLSDGCTISGNKLLKPWVGKLMYSDSDGGHIYGYTVSKSFLGSIKIMTLKDTEYFEYPSIGHQSGTSTITVALYVNFRSIYNQWAPVPTNFKVHVVRNDDVIPSLSLTNETFGGLSNSMNTERLNNGLSSPVAITNVQLIEEGTDGDTVLYEFEYLPIIYDEKDQHMSFNYVVVLDKGDN